MPLMPVTNVERAAKGLNTLYSQTLVAPAANFDVNPIDFGGYTVGVVVAKLRSVRAGQSEDSVRCQLNGDTGGNYATQYGQQADTGWTLDGDSGQTSFTNFGTMPAATSDSGFFAQFRWEFGFPADNDADHTFTGQGVAPLTSADNQLRYWFSSGRWGNTDPITRITIFSGNGQNLDTGSKIRVFGY